MAAEKSNSLSDKIANLTKKYGAGAVLVGDEVVSVERLPTGSLALDIITGGGYGLGRIIELYGPESSGKAQPLSSKILTPFGWKTMGDMEIGSIVSTPDGGDTTVVGIYPQGVQDVYEITFDDKSKTRCTLDHLWMVYTRNSELGDVLSTEEIIKKGVVNDRGVRRFKIPTSKPINFSSTGELPLDPYLLGLFIGDGGLTDKSVRFSTYDLELVEAIRDILANKYPTDVLGDLEGKCTYRIKKAVSGRERATVCDIFDEMGLLGKYSYEKSIPEAYLRASIEDRVALFQGMMDTDGSVENGSLSYSTSSKELADNFVDLCRGLGMRCVVATRVTKYRDSSGKKVDGRPSHRVSILQNTCLFQPFRLNRRKDLFQPYKSAHAERFIERVELVGQEECQCIAVGHPDRLYITDDYIVTHNTTISIHALVEAQKAFPKKMVAVIDAEHALDKDYCEALGLDMSKAVIAQPSCGEEALDIAEELLSSGEISVMLIDSVAALVPKAEIDGEMSDSQMGLQARLMSKAMRKLTGLINKTNSLVIFTNQLRSKIGVVYGSPEVTSGGNALKFYASIRIDVRKAQGEKNGDEVLTSLVTCKTVKNKLAPPFRKCQFEIEFGKGIDRVGEVISVAEAAGLIIKKGSWYYYGETKLAQGFSATKELLKDNLELVEEITKIVKKNIE